ncbi:hypothetical protein N9954_03045 [Maribacter sp.]|nr:hypothetical protein [Maribacter sp.]
MKQKSTLNSLGIYLSVFLFLMTGTLLFAQQDTLYFTSRWKPTVKDSAAFFRPPLKKEGDLFRVQDYFGSGQLQMNAVSKSSEKDLWEGTVTWYNEDGSVFQEGTYKDNRLEGDFITYMGTERLVATYANGRFVSGKRNISYGQNQMYFVQESDTLHEIIYEKDVKGIREEHFGTKDSYRFYSKYYGDNGILIGERKVLPNNYSKGIEVLYYSNPMRVKEIRYYPFGQLLVAATYYQNGQIREEVKQEPEWSKTYYSVDGKELGKMVYQINADRLKPMNGTELFFAYTKGYEMSEVIRSARSYENGIITKEEQRHANGEISNETTYKDGSKELQVSYDKNGKEMNRMVYKDYRPFQGTEVQIGRKATYEQGALVEEILYYLNTEIPKIKKSNTLETYYSKEGEILGELNLKEQNGYPVPFEGKRFSMDYAKGDVSGFEEFKDGIKVKQTSYRKRQVGEKEFKTYKRVEEFDAEGYQRIRETKFYSNGNRQSEITYKGYREVLGKFYDEEGTEMGAYDYVEKDGTRYVFFGDSDQIEEMEELKEGKVQRSKRYTYGKSGEYGQINPILEQDIDVDCCATYYTLEGEVIAKLTFKNQLPWEGMAYDHSARKKYEIRGGKRDGSYQKLDYDQKIVEEGQFADDKEEGLFKYYSYQGDLLRTENFKAGRLNGQSVYYNPDGTVVAQIVYENDLPMNGIKMLNYYSGREANQETYKDGKKIVSVFYDKNGKRVTKYEGGKESAAVAYYKDSDKKRLSYELANGSLHGAVIRYDSDGKEQHRALFKAGRLESGTIYITPAYQDAKVLYMIVNKEGDTVKLEVIDVENKVVLKAEEVLTPGSNSTYLNKLDVGLDYIGARNLY